MDNWLRVPSRVLMVELAVVGLIIGTLFFVFLSTPQPAWLPAVVLWGVTIGFIVYRIVASSSRRVRHATTQQIAIETPAPRPRDEAITQREKAYAGMIAADVGWQESVPEDVFSDPWTQPEAPPDAEDSESLRATLFDVPSVAETDAALRKLDVFTDDELADARAETMMLDSVADAESSRSELAATRAELPAVGDEWTDGNRRTLDEETWRALLADGDDERRTHEP